MQNKLFLIIGLINTTIISKVQITVRPDYEVELGIHMCKETAPKANRLDLRTAET